MPGLLSGAAEAAATFPVPLDAPSVIIANDLVRVKIYLIDARKGFYRGQRFDQAGVVGRLSVAGRISMALGSTVSPHGTWMIRTRPKAW